MTRLIAVAVAAIAVAVAAPACDAGPGYAPDRPLYVKCEDV